MTSHSRRKATAALLAAIGTIGLSACTTPGVPVNRSLESVHQPVVQHTNFTMDVATGYNGLSSVDKRRLAAWFEAMDLRYGDRIAIDDPVASSATRADIEAVAARFGMLLTEQAPATPGYVASGSVRVVITRASASVKGCPDWGTKSDTNLNNATASGYGCAINGNLAAMVANPDDLLQGQRDNGKTVVMSSTKAIDSFRAAVPSGGGGANVKTTSSKGE